MTSRDEQVRVSIAEQASDWFVSNDEAPLDPAKSAELVEWLRASPVHVEELLGVAGIARDLKMPDAHPESSLDALLKGADAESEQGVTSLWSQAVTHLQDALGGRRQPATILLTAVAVMSLGAVGLWKLRPAPRVMSASPVQAVRFETRHGEQKTYRLADGSVLHLNTDTAATVQYTRQQRLVALTAGEAALEVVHDSQRPFRLRAGPAEVLDLGTRFNVRLESGSAVVTVVEGRVAVEPAGRTGDSGAGSKRNPSPVQLGANQQVSVVEGEWPAKPVYVDARRATSWMERQIAFDHEPLELVVAEFNRYAAKPIEITAPGLRNLQVSGVFSTDDPQEFIAFLRSLERVKVEVTATVIRVSQQ